jgi:hypothetical protein
LFFKSLNDFSLLSFTLIGTCPGTVFSNFRSSAGVSSRCERAATKPKATTTKKRKAKAGGKKLPPRESVRSL